MALVLVACGDGDSLSNTQSSFTDEWVGGDVAPGSASTEPPGSVAQPYDGNEDEIYDDDLLTHEAFIYGEAQVSPGTSFDGMSEFWILHYPEDGDEEVLCQATWTLSAVESVQRQISCERSQGLFDKGGGNRSGALLSRAPHPLASRKAPCAVTASKGADSVRPICRVTVVKPA